MKIIFFQGFVVSGKSHKSPEIDSRQTERLQRMRGIGASQQGLRSLEVEEDADDMEDRGQWVVAESRLYR